MPSSLVAPIVGAAASTVAGKVFGGGNKSGRTLQQNPLTPFSFGGLEGDTSGGRLTITRGADRATAINRSQELSRQRADQIAGIRSKATDAVTGLTATRMRDLEDRRSRSIGNLRENLARRRLLGSSFAGDALIRAEAEFAKAGDEIRGTSILQSLDLETALIREESAARLEAINTGLADMNLQAEIGTQLLSGVTAQLGANQRLMAELQAQSSAGLGKLFAPVADAIGTGVSDLING